MASSPDNPSAAIPPRTGSGSTPEIDPQLENVLRNLNVNLEDELTRYRRQRHGRVPPPPPPRRSAQRQTIDLISVPASSESIGVTPDAPSPRPVPPPPPPNPFLNQASESADNESPDADQAAELLADLSGLDELAADLESADPDPNTALPVHANDTPTEEYLESSQELLKSIADDQAEPDSIPKPYSPERRNNGLLKLAGLILVLLGGVGVGFAITYPSQLQKLRSQLWPAGTETADTDTTEATDPGETPPEVASEPGATSGGVPDAASETNPDGYKPPGPDLSTREFKELDLESLSTLDVDSAGAPASPNPPLANPAQTPIPTASPAGQPPASPAGATSSAAAPTTPAPAGAPAPTGAPAPVAVAPSPAPAAATGSNFYVIASYTGDDSLNQARELVPDAFVRNFQAGARIQLAAFDNQAQAEDQVAALTQQGATVELFGPTNE